MSVIVTNRAEVSVTAKAIAVSELWDKIISSKIICPGSANITVLQKPVNQRSNPLVLPMAPNPTIPANKTIAGGPSASLTPPINASFFEL